MRGRRAARATALARAMRKNRCRAIDVGEAVAAGDVEDQVTFAYCSKKAVTRCQILARAE